ncbi:TrkH family potassium uptake protein [Amaricoccus sp.]|uniref:TrkH family potassium uptake protein n=1 Tax=Amaricoccus sp. TaxID=1872485 RepID=UPI001B7943DC|nr:TrkH family potassium uptake protein [Amaricoccus sp.]MBP7241572.1 TrkH family potassium uptake protein [Amaricoccus sp.]
MVDFRPVGHILGWLLAALGASMAIPLAIDLADRNGNAPAFALSMALTTTLGVLLAVACSERRPRDLDLRQGVLLTVGAWAAFTGFATLPLMLGEPDISFVDALFETTSAMTTTGATVIVGLDDLPRGVLAWRSLVTWIGGIGVVLLAIILLPVLGVGGMQLLRSSDFNTLGKVMPKAKEIALSFSAVYLALTLACTLGYVWGGLSEFDALTHAMSTIATGGMGNYDASFINFSATTQYVGAVFMLLGGMSFVRFVQLGAGDPKPLFQDSQIRAFLAIYLVLCLGLLVARIENGDRIDEPALRAILFNMSSIITTTGFVSADYIQWGPLADTLFFCAMMVCGCTGSTAGGPKVFRYQLLAAAVAVEIGRLYSPSAVHLPRLQGRAVTAQAMNSVVGFFMLFFLTLGIGAVLLVLLGLDPVTAISGAAATLSNVGPGLGPVIGPVGNYASLSDPAILVLTFLMLVGRLELLLVYVLFTAAFWRA